MTAGALIVLFNRLVDYVRYDGVTATPCDRRMATHQLVCTRWNGLFETSDKKRVRERKTRPDGYALAVCARPLKRRRTPVTTIRIRRPLRVLPHYDYRGSIGGKRRVLSSIAAGAATPYKLRKHIRTLPSAKLDSLYRHLLNANAKALRRK